MARRLNAIVRKLEREIKPTLRNSSEHLGFCTALEHLQIRLGPDILIVEPGDVILSGDATIAPVCPVCRSTMRKDVQQDLDFSLTEGVAAVAGETARLCSVIWRCDCGPVEDVLPLPAPVCPDCRVTMRKEEHDDNPDGVLNVVWTCDCLPAGQEDAEEEAGDHTEPESAE